MEEGIKEEVDTLPPSFPPSPFGDNAHDLIVSELLATPPPQEEWKKG